MKIKHLFLSLIAVIVTACTPVIAQQIPTEPLPLSSFLTNAPVLGGPAAEAVKFLTQDKTNWMFATYAIYDEGTHHGGAGVGAFYNINEFFGAGLRLDGLATGTGHWEVWMPSGNFQLSLPLRIMGKVDVIPFAFSGIAFPVSGGGNDSDLRGIFGAGLAVRVAKHWDIAYDYEKWSGFKGNQHRLGFIYKF